MKRSIKIVICTIVFIATSQTMAQKQTLGLLENTRLALKSTTLFSKNGSTFLINNEGEKVHHWAHGRNTQHPGYLQSNGDLFVVSRGVTRYDFHGNLLWRYNNPQAHHDIAILPNGNVLLLIYGAKTYEQAIAAGRNPALLADNLEPMVIYEVNPENEVLWQWHVWDHLVQDFDDTKDNFGAVEDHPELVDINFTRNSSEDWLHGNAIDYNPTLDQIVVSPRFNSEIWIIDHSTTTEQAASNQGGNAGKGGDLLYRWGNPIAYRAGDANDQTLFGSHDVQWIKENLPGAGNLLVFNNGGTSYSRDGNYSTIDEFTPPIIGYNYELEQANAYGPKSTTWSYSAPVREDFYSSFISGTQRLQNGNTFINEGENGRLFEVNHQGEIIWEYKNAMTNSGAAYQGDSAPQAPMASLFRAYKYPESYLEEALLPLLVPQWTIELYDLNASLLVLSSHPDLIEYPGEGNFSFGVGQLLTLSVKEIFPHRFVGWMVQSGDAMIGDAQSIHTTFTVSEMDSVIQARFETSADDVFFNDFE